MPRLQISLVACLGWYLPSSSGRGLHPPKEPLVTNRRRMSGKGKTFTLYVADLRRDVTENDLRPLFGGEVASIRLVQHDDSLGHAYVNYRTLLDAERALVAVNLTPIRGKPCRISWDRSTRDFPGDPEGNLRVSGISLTLHPRAFFQEFAKYGPIVSCKLETDDYGKIKGFGFVQYERKEDAAAAIEALNGGQTLALEGQTLQVFPGCQADIFPHDGTLSVTRCQTLVRPRGGDATAVDWTTIFVGNLSPRCQEAHLREIFGNFGEIESLAMSLARGGDTQQARINYTRHDSAVAV
ncbi:putative polyadenylate binding protein [Paratrimastix pyriformis]|uniref:Polyadenylate binding protein n=1 Tax=Paratrimastix pyriformis TaxID=342808 RepID=A0ABQ8U9P5_9EUKA|nr:putative polyadenylate binding protein [Paratrimastix pyriformis]